MSSSSKYDLSSSSPDRPYPSGHRSSYSAASLDRSGSLRESVESPSLSSSSNATRSSISATKGDVLSFLQCLRFDPNSMIGDHKLNRPGDFKRMSSVALGIPQEDLTSASSICKTPSSPLPEDFRRLKAGLKESCSKSRERAKIFSESLSVINKWFPSIPSRKRSRLDASSCYRPKALLQNDRSVSVVGISKMGSHSHASSCGIESEQHKTEEMIKAVPNKRTRTSMVDSRLDVRVGTSARTLIDADQDGGKFRYPSGNEGQADSRTLPISVDSWEKSKLKKKRSGIKHDVPKNLIAAKPSDGMRVSKQGLHQRISVETRPRYSDTHGFRSGMVNGGVGVGKADGIPQESEVRSSLSRTDFGNNMLLHDRRDYPAGSDKEMVIEINKLNARENFRSGNPKSNRKMKAIPCTVLSGSGLLPKLSPDLNRAAAASDWEVSHLTKDPAANGVNKRKCSVSAQSSSPPVAQWAGQRPQKISRTARRTNLPIVPSPDATPPPDGAPYEMGSERCLIANSPQLAKLKCDNFSPLSENEESGTTEIKTKEKKKKNVVTYEKAVLHAQKMETLLPPRKNKVFDCEGQGGIIRKRGRTGRTASTRSLMHLKVEKVGNSLTAKELRTSRLGLDKNESKGRRPQTRRLVERKPYSRKKHTTVNATADYFVTSNDGHEELLAATIGVLGHAEAISSPFWKKTEPYFRYISDMDVAYLKHQILIRMEALESNLPHIASNSFGSSEDSKIGSTTVGDELKPEQISSTKNVQQISLYQRLIAALVPEEGNEEVYRNERESIFLDTCISRFEHELDFECGHGASNGHTSNANGRCFDEQNNIMPDNSITPILVVESKYNEAKTYLCPDQQVISEQRSCTCSEEHYNCMSINERLLLEIQSVGIFPDQVPYLESSEDDEIEKSIGSLHGKYNKLVSKKQNLLRKLLPSASEARELQEKDYESRALDKLVEMAYEKYMACFGPSAHAMKGPSGKMAKQVALAFIVQSLERYREFEQTGSSCFGVPVYKDIFISWISRLNDLQSDSMIGDDSGELHASLNECSTEIRASAPLDVLCSPSPEYDSGKDKLWLNRVKEKELSLDDVGDTNGISSGVTSGIRSSFSSCSKGKRSERDRKGSGTEVLARQGTAKIGGSVLTDVKGDRKPKTKPKQKSTRPSPSNSPTRKKADQSKPGVLLVPKLSENARGVGNDDIELLDDPIDLSGLQIPEMGDFGVHDDFSGQGEDIGSWLNIDEDGLHDDDFMGLEIPMDDLSDLNMMV